LQYKAKLVLGIVIKKVELLNHLPLSREEEKLLEKVLDLSKKEAQSYLEKTIKKAYEFFEEASRKKKTVPQAAEWLLDNYYIIEEAFAQF